VPGRRETDESTHKVRSSVQSMGVHFHGFEKLVMRRLFLFGATETAEVADYYFSKQSDYTVEAFVVDDGFASSTSLAGKSVVSFTEYERDLREEEDYFFVAIGYSKLNRARAEKFLFLKNRGIRLASFVSPEASVADNVQIGLNVMVLEKNTLQPFSLIGDNVVIWSGNHLGHHSTVGNHVFISSGVVIAGHSKIEPFCFLGVNSSIINGSTIGENSVVGAGVNVAEDVPAYSAIVRGQRDKVIPGGARGIL